MDIERALLRQLGLIAAATLTLAACSGSDPKEGAGGGAKGGTAGGGAGGSACVDTRC